MEGFKSLPKMQCFKEGGSVKAMAYGGKMKKGGHSESKEMSKDIAQDKKVVKKAFAMHDKQSHEGEKTNLSKLKKGGRMKKEVGTVKKYKAGGAIEMKKDAGDKDDIKKVKQTKPKKAAAPSAASKDVMNTPKFFNKGGAVKKCNAGGSLKSVDAEKNPGLAELPTNVRNKMGYAKKGGKVKKYSNGQQVKDPQKLVDDIALEENTQDREMIMKPVRAAGKMITKGISAAKSALKGSDAEKQDVSNIAKKKGGKIKKFNTGGSTGPLTAEEEAYLGGADRTDPFIMARMRRAIPQKQNYIPNAVPAMDNRDVGQTVAPALAPMDSTLRDETGAPSTMQRNEYGDLYTPINQMTPAAPVKTPVRRPAAAPAAPAAPSISSTDTARLDEMARGLGVFPEGSAALPRRLGKPQSVGKRFFTATPEEQAASFGRGAEARKNLGKRVGRLSMPSFSDALDRYKS